jgi:hypothetical protein
MPRTFGLLIATVLLASAMWMFFYDLQPGVPLRASETSVIVAIAAAMVFASNAGLRYFKRQRENRRLK